MVAVAFVAAGFFHWRERVCTLLMAPAPVGGTGGRGAGKNNKKHATFKRILSSLVDFAI